MFSNPLAAAHYITMLEWITIYSSVKIHFHVSHKHCQTQYKRKLQIFKLTMM